MALIECPECGRKVSDKAVACPQCGYPISGIGQIAEEESVGRSHTGKSKKDTADNEEVRDSEGSALPSEDEYVNVDGYTMEELYPERFSDSKAGGSSASSKTPKRRRTSSAGKDQTASLSHAVTYEKSQAIPRYTGTIYEYKPIATKHHILSKLAFGFIWIPVLFIVGLIFNIINLKLAVDLIWIPGLGTIGLILAIIDLIRNKEYRHGLSYAAIIIFAGATYVLVSLNVMNYKAIERENAARNQTTVTEDADRTKKKAPKEKNGADDEERLPYDYILDEQ